MKKKLPTLEEYVRAMTQPKFCPACGKKMEHVYLHTKGQGFPFWDFTCSACGFAGEIEPDVPIGATR